MGTEESKQIFCWVEIVREEKVCAGDLCLPCGRPMPVHTGDKALTQETPAQRGELTTGMLPIITSQLIAFFIRVIGINFAICFIQ